MPIDPQIALQVRPAQAPDVMQAFGNALAMKSHIQQQQLHAGQMELQGQQLQAASLENQERQMKLEQIRVYNAAIQYASGGDSSSPTAPAPTANAPKQAAMPSTGQMDPNDVDLSPNALVAPTGALPPTSNAPAAAPASAPPSPSSTPADQADRGAMDLNEDAAAPKPAIGNALAAPVALPPASKQAARPTAMPAITGVPTLDYDKVVQYLAQHNQGSEVMGVLTAQAKYRQEIALQHKTEAEAHEAQMDQVAQLFQAVNAAPADQKDAVYQLALRTAVPLAQKYGIDASHFPTQYDASTTPEFINQVIAHATKLSDYARQTHEAADLQFRMSTGLPKMAKDIEDQYKADISLSDNQDDLTLKNKKWAAIAKADPTGNTAKILQAVAVPTWTRAVSTDATLDALKPEDRIKYFTGQLNDAAQRLKSAALRGPTEYTRQLGIEVGKNPDMGNLFPAAPAGAKWDGQSMATQAASVGATGEQFITAQNTTKYREDMIGLREQLIGLRQQQLNDMEAYHANGRPLTRGQMMTEERNIANDEYGTPSRPGGLQGEVLRLGAILKNGTSFDKNKVPVPMTVESRAQVTAQYQGAVAALQTAQLRKADLYGIEKPDLASIQNAQPNETVTTDGGATWTKHGDVLYYGGGGTPTAATPAKPGGQPNGSAPQANDSTVKPNGTAVKTPDKASDNPKPAKADDRLAPPPAGHISILKSPDGKQFSIHTPENTWVNFTDEAQMNGWLKSRGYQPGK